MSAKRLTDAQLVALGDVLDLIAIGKRTHRSMRALLTAYEIPIEIGGSASLISIESQIRMLLEAQRKPERKAA